MHLPLLLDATVVAAAVGLEQVPACAGESLGAEFRDSECGVLKAGYRWKIGSSR
jgi:hypothetical protein